MAFKVKSLADYQIASFGQDGQGIPTGSDKEFQVIGGLDVAGTSFVAAKYNPITGAALIENAAAGQDSFGSVIESADVTGAVVVVGSADGSSLFISELVVSAETPTNYFFTDVSGTVISTKFVPGSSVWTKTYDPPLSIGANADFIIDASATANISVDARGYYV